MQMDFTEIYKMYAPTSTKPVNWQLNVNERGEIIPVRLEKETEGNILMPTITDVAASLLTQQAENEILHPDISKFGHTTNVLIYSLLDNKRGQQFTREEIRNSLEQHKLALKDNGMDEQHLTRIRIGKASVNYWIDRLVENGSLNKKHSNPVLFWLAR